MSVWWDVAWGNVNGQVLMLLLKLLQKSSTWRTCGLMRSTSRLRFESYQRGKRWPDSARRDLPTTKASICEVTLLYRISKYVLHGDVYPEEASMDDRQSLMLWVKFLQKSSNWTPHGLTRCTSRLRFATYQRGKRWLECAMWDLWTTKVRISVVNLVYEISKYVCMMRCIARQHHWTMDKF